MIKKKGSAKEVELKKVKSEITQRWKQQNPEKQRIYNQTYAQHNRSVAKARESDEGIDLDLDVEIFKAFTTVYGGFKLLWDIFVFIDCSWWILCVSV